MHGRILAMVALAAGLMLAACNAPGADSAEHPPGEHSIDPASGERRMVIHREDGAATLRAGPGVPVTLPQGFSLIAGAKVVSNAIAARPGGQGVLLSFETDAAADGVLAHYRAEAEAAGFAIVAALDTADARTLAAARAADGATFTLTVTRGEPTSADLAINTGAGR